MSEEKKKPDEEQNEPETGTQPPTEQTKEQTAETDKPEEKAAENAADDKQTDKDSEGSDDPTADETPPATPTESETEPEAAPPELSETDKLKEENFRLKTQLEAMKIGFMPDVIEDAVVLAENIVKRDSVDITKALQAVAKKYPDWKTDSGKDGKAKGGIKIGADSSGQTASNDDKLRQIFGIKKKN